MRLSLALLMSAALAPAIVQAQSGPAAQTTVPPIAFTQRTLPNGLRVYAIRDTTTPNVSVQVWYDVGSKDDPAGRSGFAHMFEHLMFKATRNLAPEQMDRLTEDVGGYNNASTNDDYTNYYEVIPANHLQRLLFAEADRMASLVVEPVSFGSERDVVKEELRQRTLASPYGKLFSLYYPAQAYSVHPYARGTIGSLADLQSAKIEDVRAFHAAYYRPDNAVLLVAGNFDPAQLTKWVDRYFSPIKRPTGPIPRVSVKEPDRTTAVSRTVYEPNTPLPAILMSWHVPADRGPDTPALTVLADILATGESSRLYESLVYRQQIAQSAEAFLDTKQGTGNLVAFAILAGGKSPDDGEAALRAQIARLRDQPVTEAELTEAKNEIVTAAIKSRETAEGKAQIIASSVIIDDDPHAADKQLAAIATVTATDVQRVARQYLTDAKAATIRYLPLESKPAGDTPAPITVASTVQAQPLPASRTVAVVTPAPQEQRLMPPLPGEPVAATLPTPVEVRLANGLRVITIERHDLPIVTASLIAAKDYTADPAGRSGTRSMTNTLLTKGTTTRSATQIARAIESLGGAIDSNTDRDGASVEVTVKSDQVAPAMTILADVARHPAFKEEEIARARTQAIDAVTLTMKDPAQLAGLVAARIVFGERPYGAPVEGTPASLKAIERKDLVSNYRTTWEPKQSALIMVGDITPVAARALAEQQLGDWRSVAPASAVIDGGPGFPSPRVIVVDMPDAGQAGVVVARPGITRTDARYYPLAVANTVLGGGFSSRLNQEVRIKRGLAYGASSSVQARRRPGLITARTQTKNPTAPEVIALITDQMRRMGTTPVPADELIPRKASLIGGFGRAIETTDGIAGILGNYIVQSVPLAELQRYTKRVEAVEPQSVESASAAIFDPKAASIVVVGDSKQFVTALRKTYPDLELISADKLNLDSPTLK